MSYLKLFLIFTKIGAILLGGGYVILPILTSEFTDKYKLISGDDMMDYYALSQSLPGIVAANVSMFVGYKIKGILGAIISMVGIIFVPFWTIVVLASIIVTLENNSLISSVLQGIGIAVIALIVLTAREMWQKSSKNTFYYFIFTLSLISLFCFKLSPVQTIIIYTLLGVIIKKTVGDKI